MTPEILEMLSRPMADRVSLAAKLTGLEPNRLDWIGRVNDCNLFVMNATGEFCDWHSHEETDDFFLVLTGRLTIALRDREIVLGPGELFVIPCNVEHRPRADVDSQVLVICSNSRAGKPTNQA
jgi:mannose-6-phosphate isomerase-like protein (cupin superfamily)